MTPRSVLALVLAVTLAGCNKPSPEPSAAAPDTGSVDTLAAAGAPIADSATMAADSAAPAADSVATTDTTLAVPSDSIIDSLETN